MAMSGGSSPGKKSPAFALPSGSGSSSDALEPINISMTESEWNAFLTEYNRELLAYEQVVEALPRDILKAGWLGFAGVELSELIATERQFAVRLPPSYREFLKASNGWRFPSVSVSDLRPLAKVSWFREQNQHWIDAYLRHSGELPQISDTNYFVYGKKQDSVKFRPEYLQTALQISEVDDSAVVLLNPQVITPEGEWETWLFANWLPGAVRYRSFGEWLAHERKACRKHLRPLPAEKATKYAPASEPVSLKKGQAAARDGRTQYALKSLEPLASAGNASAAASLAELYAFLGKWEKVIVNAGRLIAHPESVQVGNVFEDMIRLLGQAGHRSGEWSQIIKVLKAARKANARRSAALIRNQKDKLKQDMLRQEQQRKEKIFGHLLEYARQEGKAQHELAAVFGVNGSTNGISLEERKAWCQKCGEER